MQGHVWQIAAALAACAVPADAARAGDVPAPQPRWQATWSQLRDDATMLAGQAREPLSNLLQLERHTGGRNRWFVRHRYDILDLPEIHGVPAATNGHVHRLSAGAEWQADGTLVRLEPAIAVSSNVGRHPKSFTASDVLPGGAFDRRVVAGDSGSAWLGLRADDRLGRYLAYPALRWSTPDAGPTQWQVGFPDSHWRHRWARGWSLQVGAGPDGGQWQVRDRELERRSRVRVASWRFGAALRWEATNAVTIELAAGRSAGNTLRYTLQTGEAVRLEAPGALYGSATVSARL